MAKPLIKICGIRSATMAQQAVAAGANFIGIICHPGSKRYLNEASAKEIAQVTRAAGGIPVAVFVDHSAVQMQEFCERNEIDVVQLHGDNARIEHGKLPQHYRRIYACPVGDAGIRPDDLMQLQICDPQRDYVLFDHTQAGSGQVFAWEKLAYSGPLRTGIAGGIHNGNVLEMLASLAPELVDISSGVECDISGEKDVRLIQEFIKTVNDYRRLQCN